MRFDATRCDSEVGLAHWSSADWSGSKVEAKMMSNNYARRSRGKKKERWEQTNLAKKSDHDKTQRSKQIDGELSSYLSY